MSWLKNYVFWKIWEQVEGEKVVSKAQIMLGDQWSGRWEAYFIFKSDNRLQTMYCCQCNKSSQIINWKKNLLDINYVNLRTQTLVSMGQVRVFFSPHLISYREIFLKTKASKSVNLHRGGAVLPSSQAAWWKFLGEFLLPQWWAIGAEAELL